MTIIFFAYYIQYLMKFGSNLRYLAIPEWKQCYIDYQHLKIFITIIKTIVQSIHQCEQHLHRIKDNGVESGSIIEQSRDCFIEEKMQKLKAIGEKASQLYFQSHIKTMEINRLFLHMKLLQTRQYFKKCQVLDKMHLPQREVGLLLQIVQFIYVQTSLLQNAKQINLEGERKIIKKYCKYSEDYFQTPRSRNKKVLRISRQLKKFLAQIENFYVKHKSGPSKQNRNHLRQLAKKIQSSNADSFIFGTWIGICLTIVGVLITILTYTNKSIETDLVFNRDFPTWRGIAFFIIFIWILGLNVYGFQTYSISHRIIFQFNQHHYSTSTAIFKIAGFFSTYFLVMFSIYTLEIAGIVQVLLIPPYFLVSFVWGLFLLYLINPLPILSFRSRLYTIKLAFKSLLAPIFGVTFPVIWFTDQLVTLITPFRDLAYTICLYSSLAKQSIESSSLNCSSSGRVEVVFVVGAITYICRIFQCFKQGYDKGSYFGQPQFWNTVKYSTSLVTLTLSYFWKAGNNNIFYAWIVFAAISTIYSYIWDVKIDFALLQKNSPRRFLRQNLCYPIWSYYFVIVINFILRISWILTLSPSITNNSFGSPQIFSLVTGTLEIMRRGIWNMLRVERQHIANCKHFKATPNTITPIENLIINNLRQRNQQSSQYQISNENIAIQRSNENQRQEIANQIKIVKEKHLQILNQLLQVERRRKIEREEICRQLKKEAKKLKNLGVKNGPTEKKNKIMPLNNF